MITKKNHNIFKSGSKTYFYSSLFFPKDIKEQVYVLYAFVRKADNLVDSTPQDVMGFNDFVSQFNAAWSNKPVSDDIISEFVALAKEKSLKKEWIDSFLFSMQMDITKKQYFTLEETIEYMYGSAEVIGLMLAKFMGLPGESFEGAKALGKAMQYINFIRDINEDLALGRTYLPAEERNKYNLPALDQKTAGENPKEFCAFIASSISLYLNWQSEAEKSFHFIPKRLLVPIKTASDMYNWTARRIRKDPFVIYEKKVKPSKLRIILYGVKNLFMIYALGKYTK